MDARNERGSLSLEQVLFISAVVLITSGIGAFYSSIGNYFQTAAAFESFNHPTNPTGGSGTTP